MKQGLLAMMFLAMLCGRTALAQGERTAEAEGAKMRSQVAQARQLIEEHYAGDAPLDDVMARSFQGMLRALDPHSAWVSREEWEKQQQRQSSRIAGIGAGVGQRGNGVFLLSPQPNAPAARAGLRHADRILKIDGASITGWNVDAVIAKLQATDNSTLTLTVDRAGLSTPLQVVLRRESIVQPSIGSSFLMSGGVGYLRMNRGFQSTTHSELQIALAGLREQGAKAILIDLRGNGGGLVEQALRVANQFLFAGERILTIEGRSLKGETIELNSLNRAPDLTPLALLIDGGTASAAEIVAGALQDQRRALIVGETSFGKGLVQSAFELSDGSSLLLTTNRYRTPNGKLIQRPYRGGEGYGYFQRNRPEPATEDGGIAPDLKAPVDAAKEKEREKWFDAVFFFVRDVLADRTGDTSVPHPDFLTPSAMRCGSKGLDGLDVSFDEIVLAAFERNAPRPLPEKTSAGRNWLARQIRRELTMALCGQDRAWCVALDDDAQVQRALEAMPRAIEMVEEYKRRAGARAENRQP